MDDDKYRVYIVDFVDHFSKRVVEVKPKNLFATQKIMNKEHYLINWCIDNDYEYSRFTQDDIANNSTIIISMLNGLDDVVLKELMFQRLSWYI